MGSGSARVGRPQASVPAEPTPLGAQRPFVGTPREYCGDFALPIAKHDDIVIACDFRAGVRFAHRNGAATQCLIPFYDGSRPRNVVYRLFTREGAATKTRIFDREGRRSARVSEMKTIAGIRAAARNVADRTTKSR
jgi:hypothetical protein